MSDGNGSHATPALGDGPLTGLRAIEFGQLLAGPYVGTLLGDFGADVVKIEAPGSGDPMRDWGRLRHNDHSLWWSVLARNKRSVALNLREPRGQEIAGELAAKADVVLENFRPWTMETARPRPARPLRRRRRASGSDPRAGAGRAARGRARRTATRTLTGGRRGPRRSRRPRPRAGTRGP